MIRYNRVVTKQSEGREGYAAARRLEEEGVGRRAWGTKGLNATQRKPACFDECSSLPFLLSCEVACSLLLRSLPGTPSLLLL